MVKVVLEAETPGEMADLIKRLGKMDDADPSEDVVEEIGRYEAVARL